MRALLACGREVLLLGEQVGMGFEKAVCGYVPSITPGCDITVGLTPDNSISAALSWTCEVLEDAVEHLLWRGLW